MPYLNVSSHTPWKKKMIENGDLREAECVRMIRNWFNACNQRGLPVRARLWYLIDMHQYLLRQNDYKKFPCGTNYYKGLPRKTYEGLLQNICSRIQLYLLIDTHRYNARTPSTLGCEGIYSHVGRICMSPNGVPASTETDSLVTKMTRSHALKTNPDK